ncbi:PQQ-dependent dehydrogenase, methanol/ethanol family [Parahaliea mediterranea]|uniref:PQQ-dependent dehydrogenase, methanol/ethanol family n=1 Tax=Parahaliea mediterranea TaxID=651086 RepID=UPI000E2EE38A|nr:PQQ-dependent dehydrogenase, methanol/ethanol family [Parahaliea mediterranea]
MRAYPGTNLVSALFVLSALFATDGVVAGQPRGDRPAVITPGSYAPVTDQRLISAIHDDANWMSYGKDYSDTRYSRLDQINDESVSKLGLAWSQDINSQYANEATPLVIDGVMYAALPRNVVWALDAKTGRRLWEFTPELDLTYGRVACCGLITRGLAAWGDNIYIATIDGQLIAVNRRSGEKVWSVQTAEMKDGYTITAAPRVVKGMIIVGNGGAEYRARGYVTAYDAESGKQIWRFYTVPGNPADGYDSEAMKMAATTWTGEWWKHGGGGNVWDNMAYDPELDLLYLGVGNGGPNNAKIRSPGGGDNLFLASIVALKPDDGTYVWHFQQTPAETWDYTATQQMSLVDLEIDGKLRKTIIQAPKNGFFYVIDRETGEFISANNYAPVNWATHIDQTTGRPVETPWARWYDSDEPVFITPGVQGAHDWQSMSYSQATGLAYIPTMHYGIPQLAVTPEETDRQVYTSGFDHLLLKIPDDAQTVEAVRKEHRGELVAWDPIRQQAAWSVDYDHPWNGGLLSTAGNLVFQGTSNAEFVAYAADSGKRLWSFPTQSSTVAAPITYSVGDEQYVAIMTGWGGAFSNALGGTIPAKGKPRAGQLLVFKLGGTASATVFPDPVPAQFPAPEPVGSDESVAEGEKHYYTYCVVCHGEGAVAGPNFPDLRHSPFIHSQASFDAVVLDGALANKGMSSFKDKLSVGETEALRSFLIHRANTPTAKDDLSSRGERK